MPNDPLSRPTLQTLPGDDVRQIMWRFSDRYDIQMLVQSARGVARGIVAQLVAQGARNSHDWTPDKNQLLKAYDDLRRALTFLRWVAVTSRDSRARLSW